MRSLIFPLPSSHPSLLLGVVAKGAGAAAASGVAVAADEITAAELKALLSYPERCVASSNI